MKKIPLTQGKYALVDNKDYEYLVKWKWSATKHGRTWRVRRNVWKTEKIRRKCLTMHRVILGVENKKGFEIDHIDGNQLNNQRKNLRFCTHAENSKNRALNKNSKTGCKGVTWYKWTNRWVARITVNKKLITLGYFKTKELAKFAYNNASIKYHGEFRRI